MFVRDHGPGGVWYVVARHYPTALMARAAWERVNRKLVLGGRDPYGVGVTRLGPVGSSRLDIPAGAPDGVHPVVAVTLHEGAARRAERLLRDGTEWTPTDDFADALILRRAHVGASWGEGKHTIRRPEGRGAQLDERGIVREHDPGRG